MILVDSSVWIDHLRGGDADLVGALEAGLVMTHPVVIGEIALGNLRRRDVILESLQALPQAAAASDAEILVMIAAHSLAGSGIGYSDAQLIAGLLLTPGAKLWTRDRRLRAVAARLALAAGPAYH